MISLPRKSLWTKTLFFIPILSFMLMSSCTSYQYVTLSGNLPQGESNDFYVENDSVLVWFSFDGQYEPVTLEINNKLSKPVYVDWSKSSIIINGESYNYNPVNIVDIIPPQAYITRTPANLSWTPYELPDKEQGTKVQLMSGYNTYSARRYDFEPEQTPLAFRCFLSLSTDEAFSAPFFIDSDFWVSAITTTTQAEPSAFQRLGNQFYLSQATNAGIAMSGLGTVSLLLLLLALGMAM